MKKKVRRVFWIAVSLVLVLAGIQKLSRLVMLKNAYYKNSAFMEDETDYDVLFLGTSHVINAVYPMELWQEYGITSYNLAGHAHAVPTTYWVMVNALDYASPELIVMDCYGLEREGKTSGEFGHHSFDTIPFSRNKVRAVFDLYETTDERMEYLWNFSIYHNRWDAVSAGDFLPERGVQKGAELRKVIEKPEIFEKIGEDDTCELDTVGVHYLRMLIEECQSRDIEVLLTFMPFPAPEEDQLSARYVQQIAEEYGVNYINFLDLDVVDYDIDCCDAKSHLNASGAQKVTSYLGDYIQTTYDIADHREDAAYKQWQEDYQTYAAYIVDETVSLESLQNYLMMLSICDLDYYIYIRGESGILQSDDIYVKLLRNLAGDQQLAELQTAVENREDYFLAAENGSIAESVGEEARTWKEKNMGQDEDSVSEVQIIIVNPVDNSVVDGKRFSNRIAVITE